MNPNPKTARLRTIQWVIVAGWIVVVTTLAIMDLHHSPEGNRTPWGCAMGFLSALAHGMWITLDAQILGRRVGSWRFAAFFLGPLTIWAWFVVSYGRKSLFLIPISIAVYLIPVAQVTAAGVLGFLPEEARSASP